MALAKKSYPHSAEALRRKAESQRSLAHICNGSQSRDRSRKAVRSARLGIFAETRGFLSNEGRVITNSNPW